MHAETPVMAGSGGYFPQVGGEVRKGGSKYDGDGERALAFVFTFAFVDHAHDVGQELESRLPCV